MYEGLWDSYLFWTWTDNEIFCEDDQTGVVINTILGETLV